MDSSEATSNTRDSRPGTRKTKSSFYRGSIFLRLVFIIAILITLIIFIIIWCNMSWFNNVPFKPEDEICDTEVCSIAGLQLKNSLNKSIDPCDDFFQFVCDGWIRDHPIAPDNVAENNINVLNGIIDESLRRRLEYLLNHTTEQPLSQPLQLAIDLYDSCMQKENMDILDIDPLRSIFTKIYGEGTWPLIDEIYIEESIIEIFVREYLVFGFNSFLDISIAPASWEPKKKVIQLSAPWFPIGRHHKPGYRQSENIRIYKETMYDFAHSIDNIIKPVKGSSADLGRSKYKELDRVVQFEEQLIQATMPNNENMSRNSVPNMKITLKQLTNLTEFDYLYYLKQLLKQMKGDEKSLNENSEVQINDFSYIIKAHSIIKRTPMITILNYIGWKIVLFSAPLLNDDTREILQKYLQAITGVEKPSSDQHRCFYQVNAIFDMAISTFYVDHLDKLDLKSQIQPLVDNIKCSVGHKMINNNQWLDSITKQRAMEKLNHMKEYLVYPEFIRHNDLLEYYYDISNESDFFVDKEYFFDSYRTIYMHLVGNNFRKLPIDFEKEYQFNVAPTTVNAFYIWLQNAIALPGAILQLPFFDSNLPVNVNYGAIGSIIGHEIIHGFDNIGRQYGKEGILQNWWTAGTMEQFEKKTNCLVNQYSALFDPIVNQYLNGHQTLTENIADNGGVRAAYYAYRSFINPSERERCQSNLNETLSKNKPKRLLHVEDFDLDQLFFISHAYVWCGHIRTKNLIEDIDVNPHSPLKYRVNMPLSNFDRFAEAFQCPRGSRMNPSQKCQVW